MMTDHDIGGFGAGVLPSGGLVGADAGRDCFGAALCQSLDQDRIFGVLQDPIRRRDVDLVSG